MDLSKIASVTAGKTKTSGISPFSELEISKVYPNPDQPRKTFTDIEELASTIKEHGLLQPITVVKKDDGYMIISGERRYKAHLHNEAKTIKAYILDTTDEKVEELTLIENIQRNDLTDFETAKYIVKLWETGRYEKKSDLAKKLGKSDSYISKAFSSLKLDDDILEDIEKNKKNISVSVMDEISRVKDKTVQKEVYKKYSDGEITRDKIKEFKEPKNKIEAHNEKFSEEFTESLKNLVNKPSSSNENFPAGNNLKVFEVSIYGDNNILYETVTIEAEDKTSALISAYKKYPNEANDENFYFEAFDIEELKATFKVNDLVQDKSEILEARIKELEKEIEELNDKEVFIVGYVSKKGNENGSGFRCRALNENEAIEIAKKENYHNLANNKNIIWEARTLKSSCNGANIFNDYIGYGFGTVNNFGTYLAVIDGDFEATITFKKNGDFIKDTNNKEYQVIIKEIETPKNKSIKKENKTVNKKTISLLELFEETVTIIYTDNDMDMGLDYSKAKKIIDESTQDSIPFDVCKGTVERAYRLIDEKTRTIKDDCIVLIHK